MRPICVLITAFPRTLIAFCLSLAGAWAPAAAQTAVDLQLVLAVDASGSVSEQRFELQKQGYVAAFRSPLLLRAVRTGARQAIAVTMVQWTGPAMQVEVVPWRLVDSEDSMLALAAAIAAVPRQLFGGGTSISGAIDHAMTLFPKSQFVGGRRVIDISGDGRNNRGRPAPDARDEAVRAGVTINGLPILAIEFDLEGFYRDNVIGGPGAFVIPAATFETFADAILKKLVIEISAAEFPGERHGPHRSLSRVEGYAQACPPATSAIANFRKSKIDTIFAETGRGYRNAYAVATVRVERPGESTRPILARFFNNWRCSRLPGWQAH